mmetsp:Transcript_26950/g.29027  ORF Transcript_26950/g.29027 Transcript_26950/m.29027 type:complete len:431 (+) Transcript_26950:158-1450(+)
MRIEVMNTSKMNSSIMSIISLFLTLAVLLLSSNDVFVVAADDEGDAAADGAAAATATEGKDEDMTNRKLAREAPKDDFDVKSHFDWGTYYDPKSIFCGDYDCYGILGFDFESFNNEKPTTKIITKRYRALSRHWHPDKSKHKDAKNRFVKIARAYEVLTKDETRKEYDMLRYNQEAYYKKYGSNVMFTFAPKSDTMVVLCFVLLLINGFAYFAQYNKWNKVCERLSKAATEDWNPSQGGTSDSKELRNQAIDILNGVKETEKSMNGDKKVLTSNGTSTNKKKTMKLTNKEKKQQLDDELRPIITKLAYENEDFGAGFHKPTWKDLVILKLAVFPYHFLFMATWQVKYWMRRIQKKDLSEDEKNVLTERAVGKVIWEFASDKEKEIMVGRELWNLSKFKEWNEEREFAKLSKSEQKQYKAMLKHQKANKQN